MDAVVQVAFNTRALKIRSTDSPLTLYRLRLDGLVEAAWAFLIDHQPALRQSPVQGTLFAADGYDSIDASTIETHFPALGERAEVIALFNACDTNSYAWMLGQPKVRGLFYRDTSESQFLRGLRALLNNECWLPRKLLADHLERTRNFGQNNADLVTCLTDKELAILRCLASGASNAEIAKQLYNSPHTVKTHLHHLFRKLKVNNRVQAVCWLHQHPGALEEVEP